MIPELVQFMAAARPRVSGTLKRSPVGWEAVSTTMCG
jgi:hypothetical protein